MYSKLAHYNYAFLKTITTPNVMPMRRFGGLIPPNQYDIPISKRLFPTYSLRHYWELWPLVLVTSTAVAFATFSSLWACNNKVDVVFKSHSRANISRTMNLRCPTVHKLFTFTQRYDPWPEMQDALDTVREAEYRALTRAALCP